MSMRLGPTVEDDAIVGRGTALIGGVTIGAGAVVGANAVVNFDVPDSALVVGVLAAVRPRQPH
jgi:serine acetyltransferase